MSNRSSTGQRRASRGRALALILATSVACSPSAARQAEAPAQAAPDSTERVRTIDHVTPARDAVGRAPTRFSWTAMPGADSYSIGVWNDVDVLVWRQNHIPTNAVALPGEVNFEPGTYFWSVSALRDEQLIAESGLAAFVVRTEP